jgi:hypothetical protein
MLRLPIQMIVVVVVVVDDINDDDDDNDEAVYIPSILTYKGLVIAEQPRHALNLHCQLSPPRTHYEFRWRLLTGT